MIINHNMSAINAQRVQGDSVKEVTKGMEKLSSGLRINRAGDDASGLALRGNLLLHEGKFEEAIVSFSRSIDREPTAVAYFDRAYCHQGVGDYKAAVADYRKKHGDELDAGAATRKAAA